MVARNEHEFRLHCVVADALNALLPDQALWRSDAAGENRDEKAGARLKRIGVKPGFPDIEIMYGGRAHFIELKKPKDHISGPGQLTEHQKKVRGRLEDQGFNYAVCHSLDEVMHALDSWEIPVRGMLT